MGSLSDKTRLIRAGQRMVGASSAGMPVTTSGARPVAATGAEPAMARAGRLPTLVSAGNGPPVDAYSATKLGS